MYDDIQRRLSHTLQASVANASGELERSYDAAVLLPLINEENPQILLTLRALHLNSHSGEVAFPGGKVDQDDLSSLHTALRETEEEVGIKPEEVQIVGALRHRQTRFGMAVKPYVGLVNDDAVITANPDELSEAFLVPVTFFRDNEPQSQTKFEGTLYNIPSYRYQDYNIWGMTAFIIMEFVNTVFD